MSIHGFAVAFVLVVAGCNNGGGDDGAATNSPPTVSITSPADGSSFVDSETISVAVSVDDPDESDLSVLDLVWAGSAAGAGGAPHPDASGLATLDLTLAAGEHDLSVTVTDPGGESAIASVHVTVNVDADGDGYGPPEDCDDADPAVHPGAVELCNDIDDDCANGPDDGVVYIDWYTDADTDGYGDLSTAVSSCEDLSATLVDDGTDCDDNDATIHPGAAELCNGLDDDCANGADDGLTFTSWFEDADGDGYGNPATEVSSCDDLSATHILDGTDCFDVDAAQNHDDIDQDGVDSCSGDCDDNNAGILPGAIETCNDLDDNCADGIDEGLVTTDWYVDADLDGYGNPATLLSSCVDHSADHILDGTDCDDNAADLNHDDGDLDGVDTCAGDCNDLDAAIVPGAVEVCNDIDDNCVNGIDEGLVKTSWYIDADLDGYGNPATLLSSCVDQSATHILDGTDCDDTSAVFNHDDADLDGIDSCTGDCNDLDAAIVPGAVEVCNDIDDNCADGIDEGLVTAWYVDADLDGFGDPDTLLWSCSDLSADHITDGSDCDDTDPAVNPLGAPIARVDGVEFSTVSAAVAAATDGATVELCGGTFPVANVMIDKVLTITSVGGNRTTSTLDGTAANNFAMLVVAGGELHLDSLTLANAKKSGVVNAITGKGGPIFVDDCLFRDNKTAANGGAIVGTDITITNSQFLRNTAATGGAVRANAPGVLTVTDTSFEANTATVSGGAFYTQTTTSFTGVDLIGNVATSNGGGGVVDAKNDTLVLTDTMFLANVAINGGGLWAFGSSVVADGTTTFDSNTAISSAGVQTNGGGVYLQANGQDVSWSGGMFFGNQSNSSAFATGGGMTADSNVFGGSIAVSDVTYDSNSTVGPVGAHTGGGLWVTGGPMTLTDILTMNNVSDYGGGTSLNSSNGLSAVITLERVTYLNNIGVHAGATDIYDSFVVMNDCTIENNTGDAIWAGLLVDVLGHFEVNNSELGSGATDNSPFDVIVNAGMLPTYNYGSAATFVCDWGLANCL